MQIMIDICRKKKLNKIELSDNSNITCGKNKLQLYFLKTITQGHPHYWKYGFRPYDDVDKTIIKENYSKFKGDPTISCEELKKIIKGKGKKEMIDDIVKNVNKFNKNISIKNFIGSFTKDLNDIDKCDFINNIYIDLFHKAGYKTISSGYEMILDKN